jgi:Fe-S cluster biosynthesis and repair protein YggX
MPERMVYCIKLKQDLPGLDRPPFSDELGKRIYENVSKQAWVQFREHLKMIINEYRLVLGTEESDRIIAEQIEKYFFGEGTKPPSGFVPLSKG